MPDTTTDYRARSVAWGSAAAHHLTASTFAVVLAGGRGSRLKQLTDWRAKPAMPFAGKLKIIDFALSNCINSGVRRVAVLTQYKAQSLIRHVTRGWGFLDASLGEFVDVVPAQQRVDTGWYSGTADAVFQNLDMLREADPEYVLVLAGDHVYKMDYGVMLAEHVRCGADATVACLEVPLEQASAFGVMRIDERARVVEFDEKPSRPLALPGGGDRALASMGIYVFNADFLYRELAHDAAQRGSCHDFGADILPRALERGHVHAHDFTASCVNMVGDRPYWRDVGTLDAYWEANMDLTQPQPELNLYDDAWPIRSLQHQLPPAKFVFDDEGRRGMAIDSLVAERLHRQRRHGSPLGAVLEGPHRRRQPRRGFAGAARRRRRPQRRAAARDRRQALRAAQRPEGRRLRGRGSRALRGHRAGRDAGHPRDARTDRSRPDLIRQQRDDDGEVFDVAVRRCAGAGPVAGRMHRRGSAELAGRAGTRAALEAAGLGLHRLARLPGPLRRLPRSRGDRHRRAAAPTCCPRCAKWARTSS